MIDTLQVIMSTGIRSPLEYLRHSNSPIFSTQSLVLALAMREENMTAVFANTKSSCTSCYVCYEVPLHTAILDESSTFPFSFHLKDQELSFVTCSGQIRTKHTLGIVFESFYWTLWISILSCVAFFLAYMSISTGVDFIQSVRNSISLVLGALGCEILLTRVSKCKTISHFLLLWSLIGILIGNLYQARLTKSLIMPIQYSTNLKLVDIVDRNYTVLLISDMDTDISNSDAYLYSFCLTFRVCRQLILDTMLNLKLNSAILNAKPKCVSNPLSCRELFAGKSHIAKIPEIIVSATNFRFMVSQLSSCSKNIVLIHNRQEMNNVVKPKLPKVVRNYRRKFKYLPLLDDLLSVSVLFCGKDTSNLIQAVVRKYIEHGLYNRWANLASMLSFRWNTGVKRELDDVGQAILLDERFVSVIFVMLIAHTFSIVVLAAEYLYSSWTRVMIYVAQAFERFMNAVCVR